MGDFWKKVLAGLAAFLLIVVSAIYERADGASPTTWPSPSLSAVPAPAVSPSLTLVGTSSPPPAPSAALELKGVVGETIGQLWVSIVDGDIAGNFHAYQVMQVQTIMPSFKGARVGFYDDPLMPVTKLTQGKQYWIETTPQLVGRFCTEPILICVTVKPGPMKTMPFYSELQHAQVGMAHGLCDFSENQAARFAKTKLYRDLLRAHGVEPIKHWAYLLPRVTPDGKLDLDTPPFKDTPSFRQMVFDGAIAPPMIVGPKLEAKYLTTNWIAALTKSIEAADLPAEAWAYAWDEGEGIDDQQALARVELLKPTGLKIMVTRDVTEPFRRYVDWFFPVVSAVRPEWEIGGAYVSCMAQHNCENQTSAAQVQPPTGDPMLVLDAPAVHARAFAWVLARLRAPRGLYYAATIKLPQAWEPGGQYSSGGNGDGTLLYPGPDGNPWPSLRLKRLQRGLQDLWYLERGGVNPVITSSKWPQYESVYEAERLRVWETLPSGIP